MSSNKGSSSSNRNLNNPSSPTQRSPRRGGEILNTRPPHRPRPITPRAGALTPPRQPPQPVVPHNPLPRGPPGFGSHPSAFTLFPQGMASAVPVGGSGGSAFVGSSSSPTVSKRGRPEKEAVATTEVGEGSDENRKKCSICGKVFASEKAVFGHMRLHRDRGWRGAHPPPMFNADEEFADVPGLNLPLAIQEEGGGVEEGGEAVEAAEEARREAEEAIAAAVERRRGIRIDLNIDVSKESSDDAPPDARSRQS